MERTRELPTSQMISLPLGLAVCGPVFYARLTLTPVLCQWAEYIGTFCRRHLLVRIQYVETALIVQGIVEA